MPLSKNPTTCAVTQLLCVVLLVTLPRVSLAQCDAPSTCTPDEPCGVGELDSAAYMCMTKMRRARRGNKQKTKCVCLNDQQDLLVKENYKCGCCNGDCPEEECTSSDTCDWTNDEEELQSDGQKMCVKWGRTSVRNRCVPPGETIDVQLRGGKCGCCDFENPFDGDDIIKTGTCPSECGATSDPTCTLQPLFDNDEPGDGYFMCQRFGRDKYMTRCVSAEESLVWADKGATCGCCDSDGSPDSCPDECPGTTETSGTPDCVTDEGDGNVADGYRMCMSVGKNKAWSFETCVLPDETIGKQLKGYTCGPCPEEACNDFFKRCSVDVPCCEEGNECTDKGWCAKPGKKKNCRNPSRC